MEVFKILSYCSIDFVCTQHFFQLLEILKVIEIWSHLNTNKHRAGHDIICSKQTRPGVSSSGAGLSVVRSDDVYVYSLAVKKATFFPSGNCSKCSYCSLSLNGLYFVTGWVHTNTTRTTMIQNDIATVNAILSLLLFNYFNWFFYPDSWDCWSLLWQDLSGLEGQTPVQHLLCGKTAKQESLKV